MSMSYGTLMQFVREHWGREQMARNGSILKALFRRWPEREVEAMVKGAALLKWEDLRAIYASEGVGRRWAMAAYWQSQKQVPDRLESLGAVFKAKGLLR